MRDGLKLLDGRCTPEDFALALGGQPEHGRWWLRWHGLKPYRGHPEGAWEVEEIRRILLGQRVRPHPRPARRPREGVWYACEIRLLYAWRDRPLAEIARHLGRSEGAVRGAMERYGVFDYVPPGWVPVYEAPGIGGAVRRFFGVPHVLLSG
ncbi:MULTISPECIES: hypothetical protein [unclassified Meiothermus]|uniref:hypothetical protein n=1 Tax=unclassified Meiothermus TaxID=370471 RepID=UPI000D7CE4EF|nr:MULTISPECIES: hypothetical protein [unclassified Meiothermus]PZA06506.1 hypothetical protein DNA98_13040 [Meiothermus sp. Pnk-1]RYM37179.1 hypothetical protein EWH23_06800 [Meiothermus sp. PNK-Is4]